MRSTQLSLRDLSGCPRSSRHGLQKSTGQNRKTPFFNDIIWRAVGAAGIPAVKETSGLDKQDGKRPGGLTLIPWHGERSLVWDVTVVIPLAAFYVDRAATDTGTVADMAATITGKQKNTRPYLQRTGSSL